MNVNCEKEINEHTRQLKEIKKQHNMEKISSKETIDNQLQENNKLTSLNNNLILTNKALNEKYKNISDIKERECKEHKEADKIKEAKKIKKEEEKMKEEEMKEAQKMKEAELKVKTQKLFGGIREQLNNFENKISGGIIGEIKRNLKTNYNNEINDVRALFNSGRFHGGANMKGGNPILFIIGAVVKIILMTVGTFIFDWWPIMMILSFYCVYIEYKMTLLTGQEVMGAPIIFLLGSYFCPCFWAIARLGIGWTTTKQTSPGLFNVLSKCTNDNISLNFDHYYGKPCKQTKCLWTTDDCYNALFGKSDSGIMGNITGNITNNMNNMNFLGNNKK